jgi:predicted nuclease of predicted toxin-antitoxin system
VRLLFDENLSRKLVARLADLFPESTHVVTEGLIQSPDSDLWDYAKKHELAIVTADADFYEMATALGPPPKVIWLRGCDYPTTAAEKLIRDEAIRVVEFLKDRDQAVLILTRRVKPE